MGLHTRVRIALPAHPYTRRLLAAVPQLATDPASGARVIAERQVAPPPSVRFATPEIAHGALTYRSIGADHVVACSAAG